jgi:hypothetical protein
VGDKDCRGLLIIKLSNMALPQGGENTHSPELISYKFFFLSFERRRIIAWE